MKSAINSGIKIVYSIFFLFVFLFCFQNSVKADNSLSMNNGKDTLYISDNTTNLLVEGQIHYEDSAVVKVMWRDESFSTMSIEDLTLLALNTENIEHQEVFGSNFKIYLSQDYVGKTVYFIGAIISDSPEGRTVTILKEDAVTFSYDKNAPTIMSANINTNNILFSRNEKVNISVTAKDQELGIEKICLFYSRVNNGVLEEPNEIQGQQYYNKTEVTENFVFKLERGYEYVFWAVAVDANNNLSERYYITNEDRGMMYDDTLPTITIEPETEVIYQEEDTYYDKEHQSFVVDIKDSISGIENISVSINGVSIEKQYGTETVIQTSYTDSKPKTISLLINTSQVKESFNNLYYINVSAKDYAGNYYQINKTLRIDNNMPEISVFKIQTEDTTQEIFTTEDDLYAVCSNEKIQVTIVAKDDEGGSGIRNIKYYLKDTIGTCTKIEETLVNENGEISIEIEPEYKGYLYAIAEDYVGNISEEYVTFGGVVLETQEEHDAHEHIVYQLANTNYKDKDGRPLYNSDTSVSVVVSDSYSGISMVEWWVTAPNDTSANQKGVLLIEEIENTDDELWEVKDTDLNFITKLEASIPITNNSNGIVLKVRITDNAGNISEKEVVLSVDKTAPQVQILFDNKMPDATYTNIYATSRTATIVVRERNFNSGLMDVAIRNSLNSVPSISAWTEKIDMGNPDNTTYTASVTFSQDGDYVFSVGGSDLAGHEASRINVPDFTIDMTNPIITVSYGHQNVFHYNYYPQVRYVTIAVQERNFMPERIRLQGTGTNQGKSINMPPLGAWRHENDMHYATVVFQEDGIYQFTVSGMDKAGNNAQQYQSDNFVIDKTAPQIIISEVEDCSANNGLVAPKIQFIDVNPNYNTVTIKLKGAHSGVIDITDWYSISSDKSTITFEDFPREQNIDDLYILEVSITDMAGNTNEESITFSVNRFGSIYLMNSKLEDVNGKYVTSATGLSFTEINVDTLLDKTIKLVLTTNGTPLTLKEGEDYTIVQDDDNSWRRYEYVLNDTLFENDGSYVLAVYSEDRAGNTNQNIQQEKDAEIVFGVDNTSPILIPINIEAGETYNTQMFGVVFTAKDNLILEDVSVWLNGNQIEMEMKGEECYFNIPESNELQDIKIIATDAAGNQTEYSIKDVLISTNFFVRWYNNKLLFWGSIGLLIILVCVGSYIFYTKMRQNSNKNI